MAVSFRTRVTWPNNDLLLPASLYSIQVPPGVNAAHVRAPTYVDTQTMLGLTRTRTQSGSLGSVAGLVDADMCARFDSVGRQWRVTGNRGANGPLTFCFTGGAVQIDLQLRLYIRDLEKPDSSDPTQTQIFVVVYEHELLHVKDELDLANSWLIPQLRRDSLVQNYLVQQRPFTYGTPRMTAAEAERRFRVHICSRLQQAAQSVWATEHNRRAALRDSPAQYRHVQSQVNALRARQANQP